MPVISPEACSPPLVVALDVGTSSARAILYDGEARKVEGMESRIHYAMDTTDGGGVEIDADRLLAIICECLDGLHSRMALVKRDAGIAAIAVSTFWHAMMGVDSGGRAATPLYSWNDTRAAAAARDLRREVDEAALHSRTGCVIHASYWPAKLRWLGATAPDLFNRVSRWMSVGEYFYLRLFGETLCSVSMASATGLFNQNESDWDDGVLSLAGIRRDQLSPLSREHAGLKGVGREHAARWPLFSNAVWFAALGDGACDNIGSGCVTRDQAALMIGTSGALRSLWKAEAVEIPRGLWCYRADLGRFVMGGALSNGGDLFAWMRSTLRLGAVEELEGQLAAMEPDAHGLSMLPFLSGERSTGWRSDARAAITGLSLDTTPVEILRAGLEAVAYRFAAIYERLAARVGEPREIIASGGALLRSPAWAQIISDVIGKPLIASDEREASSRGAALMALEALGAVRAIEDMTASRGRVYTPDPNRHALYREARERQRRLYEAVLVTTSQASKSDPE